jgi:hypothetical protein
MVHKSFIKKQGLLANEWVILLRDNYLFVPVGGKGLYTYKGGEARFAKRCEIANANGLAVKDRKQENSTKNYLVANSNIFKKRAC